MIRFIGQYTLFLGRILRSFRNIFSKIYEIYEQIYRIGVQSLILVLVTSAFTGFVTAVQASYQTKGYLPKSLIGVLVGKSTMIELAPVLTGLVLAGKVGASLAAEIGSMRVTEQIDALETLSIRPEEYLYMPRVLAGIISFPLLTAAANIVSIFSAFMISYFIYDLSFFSFFQGMKNFFQPSDLFGGLLKSLFFGFFVTVTACYEGHSTTGGAVGVGNATTKTIVTSSIMILVLDFIIATIMFGV